MHSKRTDSYCRCEEYARDIVSALNHGNERSMQITTATPPDGPLLRITTTLQNRRNFRGINNVLLKAKGIHSLTLFPNVRYLPAKRSAGPLIAWDVTSNSHTDPSETPKKQRHRGLSFSGYWMEELCLREIISGFRGLGKIRCVVAGRSSGCVSYTLPRLALGEESGYARVT